MDKERDKRLYPIDEELFNRLVLPVIEGGYLGKGRPPKVSHYQAFCGILYILRTGIPWRDLPLEYGQWHTVYDRFNRGNARGLWEQVLMTLHQGDGPVANEVIIDSTTMKVHRHGGGQKGGSRPKGYPGQG
jgi:transposase